MAQRLLVLAWLCVAGALALPAAVPTPDTMVVARSDDGQSSATQVASSSEPTTTEAVPPIKLTEMEVTSRVALRYAHTAVVTTMRNPAKRSQEATFRVLLPETAFISSFTMILDGKPYKAYVKEKEEAKQIYNQAVSQGLGAAHVATKARDSNHFTVSVNVEANTVAVFNLTYEELLVRRNGVYNHAINLHPGTLVPKLTVSVHISEAQNLTVLRVPEVRTGNEIDASPNDAQNSKAEISRSENGREATITFKPDLAEQQRLIDIYVEKTKETRSPSYVPYGYDDVQEDPKESEGVLGQFVVQYDVVRPMKGEILVNDGYFVHFFAPSELPPLSKHVVFVLDTSGSMMDRKIVQLREAMQTILSELNPGDYFSIVEFASSVLVHELKEADQEPISPYPQYGPISYTEQNRLPKLVPPSPATAENIAKAKVIVSRLQAAGGTNIYSALDVAVELINKGIGWSPVNTSQDATTEPSTSAPVPAKPKEATNSPAADAPTTEEVPKLEPMIIFLTDGDPTVGQTDPSRIISHLSEKNSGENKATIFSLAFGEDADRKFLRKLSLRNDGFMRHIYEAADAALQLRDFYRQVASPLLVDVHFVYPKKQVKSDSLTKHRFRRYYMGSETVVAGRVEDGATELTPQVGAFCGTLSGDLFSRKYIEILPKAPVPLAKEHYLPLERLWAYLTVKQLLDERDARDPPAGDDDKPDQRALDIALKYSFVTPLTSLVVVKPNATDAVDAESVHKQNQDIGFGPVLPGNYAGFAGRPSHYSGYAGPLPAIAAHSVSVGYAGQSALFSALPGAMSGPPAALDLAAFDTEEDSLDIRVEDMQPTTQYYRTDAVPTTPVLGSTTATPSALAPYRLQSLPWLAPLLRPSSHTIQLQFNDTYTVTLKLSEEEAPPRAAGGDEECARSDSISGLCVYLTRCDAAKDLTAQTYENLHCSVDGYAGVCCPKEKVDVGKTD